MSRRLDLSRAVAGETFLIGETAVGVDAWCSEPDDMLVYRMSSDGPVNVSIDVSGSFLKQSRVSLNANPDARTASLIVMGRMPGLNVGVLPHQVESPWDDESPGRGICRGFHPGCQGR